MDEVENLVMRLAPPAGPPNTEDRRAARGRLHEAIAGERIATPQLQRQRRHSHSLWYAAIGSAAACIVAVAVIAAVNTGRPDGTATIASPRDSVSTAPTFSAADVETMLTPASNGDFSASRRMLEFTALANTAAANECLVSSGYPGTEAPSVDESLHFRYFEDPDVIAGRGFFRELPPGESPEQGEDAVPADVAAKCGEANLEATRSLYDVTGVFYRWMEFQSTIEASPAVRDAFNGWGSCMESHGLTSQSEVQFLFDLQQAYNRAAPEERRALDLRWSSAYADCLRQGPLDARTAARVSFRNDFAHAQGIDWARLAGELNTAVRDLNERYEITWPA